MKVVCLVSDKHVQTVAASWSMDMLPALHGPCIVSAPIAKLILLLLLLHFVISMMCLAASKRTNSCANKLFELLSPCTTATYH
jgi:hypothetical protein